MVLKDSHTYMLAFVHVGNTTMKGTSYLLLTFFQSSSEDSVMFFRVGGSGFKPEV